MRITTIKYWWRGYFFVWTISIQTRMIIFELDETDINLNNKKSNELDKSMNTSFCYSYMINASDKASARNR